MFVKKITAIILVIFVAVCMYGCKDKQIEQQPNTQNLEETHSEADLSELEIVDNKTEIDTIESERQMPKEEENGSRVLIDETQPIETTSIQFSDKQQKEPIATSYPAETEKDPIIGEHWVPDENETERD